jgi:hypothetical protein
MQEGEDDVDINTSDTSTPTHNQISGLITQACAHQLNNQVSSFCCLGTTDKNETELHSRWRHSDSRTAAACDGRLDHVWTWIQACKYFLESSWSLLSYASNLKSISCQGRPQTWNKFWTGLTLRHKLVSW